MTHRIETLRWDLQLRSPRAALQAGAMQDRLARFLASEGLRRIEARFDRHDVAGHVWRIERLELDLGRLSRRHAEHQWAARLDEALDLALARARPHAPATDATAAPSSRLHAIDQFLFYLSNGHLPWGVSLPGRHALAHWLAQLAQAHGTRLWAALQADPQRETLLARLARISPHHGLHALLARRDAPLARALQEVDDAWLAPLQARGRLSAYQHGQLQQALRVAGLRVLWGARGSALDAGRRSQLLRALRQALAGHLGPSWAGTLERAGAGASPTLADGLVGELLAAPSRASPDGAGAGIADAEQPSRTWEAGLRQLREALGSARRPSAGHGARVVQLLERLAAVHPAALRQRLLQWAGLRRDRRQWSRCLTPDGLGALLAAMAPSAPAGAGRLGPGTPRWSDSLRQTALRLQREAPADRRPGLGRLQALLTEACLQRLAEDGRLPDSHSAWQALWRRAWEQWLGDTDDTPQDRPVETSPARTERERERELARRQQFERELAFEREARRAAAVPATTAPPVATSRQARLDESLRGLERMCREGRWQWPQRLRLARLLETEEACERWLRLFDESRRWRMLRAQFGAAAQRLQRRAGRLQQWLGQVLREPAARVREHWRRLCRYLFVDGLSPEQAALRGHYQAQALPAPTRIVRPASPVHEPIWVDDAGQVLLAAYAERLFRQQGLLHEGRFVDATARARAVQSLQTLVHGAGPVDEARTALSRLLCGLSPAEVLPEVAPASPATVALLEQLLQAMLAHWKAVGNTSIAGLRETFLQREGRLQREKTPADEPARWRLRVRTRGFDVLLDRLPWGFQTIRLPWMQGVLHVEWR